MGKHLARQFCAIAVLGEAAVIDGRGMAASLVESCVAQIARMDIRTQRQNGAWRKIPSKRKIVENASQQQCGAAAKPRIRSTTVPVVTNGGDRRTAIVKLGV